MPNTKIFEGKTTTEAIEKGLSYFKVSKDKVEIKVLEEDKRSFFDILAPRIVKVEMTLKENVKAKKENIDYTLSKEEIEEQRKKIEAFLKEFIEKIGNNTVTYKIETSDNTINVEILGENINYLIGYRGETLNAMQTIISSIAGKGSQKKARILLNIGGYREKRTKTLEELADKVSKTVIRTGKTITLEPMNAYERKIIHARLQSNSKIQTHSIGEEPYRKIVISLV